MKIKNLSGRELTETEKNTVAVFEKATGGEMDFALIGETTVMAIPVDTDKEDAEEAAKELMEDYLYQEPDFTPFVLDDGWCAVALLRYCFEIDRLRDDEKDEVSFGHAFSMRGLCQEACERGEVIAVCTAE